MSVENALREFDDTFKPFSADVLALVAFQKWKAQNGYPEKEFLYRHLVTNPDHLKVIDSYYEFVKFLRGISPV